MLMTWKILHHTLFIEREREREEKEGERESLRFNINNNITAKHINKWTNRNRRLFACSTHLRKQQIGKDEKNSLIETEVYKKFIQVVASIRWWQEENCIVTRITRNEEKETEPQPYRLSWSILWKMIIIDFDGLHLYTQLKRNDC